MATITTRELSETDTIDRQAIRVDALTYADKSGILAITLGDLVTVGLSGIVDIRVPNYNPKNDDIQLDEAVKAAGTYALATTVYIAVNDGVPGPAARVNPDGTWDLVDLTLTYDDGDDDINAVLNYTIAFTDLTPSTTNPSSGNATVALSVSDVKLDD